MPSRVAIIIVTYNGQQYIDHLFQSLAADSFPKDRLGIFVVDNASTDQTIQIIQKLVEAKPLPTVFIQNKKNEGFAAGNNIAIRRALDEGYDWIALLNQDTVVNASSILPESESLPAGRQGRVTFASSWIEECLRVAETDDRIGAVQPLLLLWPPELGEINSLGNEIHFLGFGFSRGYRDRVQSATSYKLQATSCEITYASGAAVLYRAAALRDVGLFNESFFMYHEDLDLGWRLWLRGWKNVLAPQAVVYHKYDFRAAPYKYYFMERNRLIVSLQNYKLATLVLTAPSFLLMELGVFGFSIIKGWWREKLCGYWWVLAHFGSILRTRVEIQKSRVVSDQVIMCRFVGTISYQEIDNLLLRRIVNPFFSTLLLLYRFFIVW